VTLNQNPSLSKADKVGDVKLNLSPSAVARDGDAMLRLNPNQFAVGKGGGGILSLNPSRGAKVGHVTNSSLCLDSFETRKLREENRVLSAPQQPDSCGDGQRSTSRTR
jgi:hypothetical protein